MGIFSEVLGVKAINLANSSRSIPKGNPLGTNKGVKSTDRINRQALELDYRYDATTFNIINTQLQLILHSGFLIKAEMSTQQKFYDGFFKGIGVVGEPITSEELVEYGLQDLLMYGNAFVELIYDAKTDTKIVDLKNLPEKKMDYLKTVDHTIATDSKGRPVGYVMQVPSGVVGRDLGDQIPKEFRNQLALEDNQIFFLPKRIAHFKLFTYGDRFYGIGLIEPAHIATFRKGKIEEARTNELYTRGANTIIATVGNENHEAGPQELEDTLDQIANFRNDRYFAFPSWVKLDTLPVNDTDTLDKTLDYLTTLQASAAGMPKPFATGAGEATNRSTLNNQQQIMESSLEFIIKKFSSAFDKYILKPIAETHNKSPARMVFGDIHSEEKNDKTKRILEYVKAGVFQPEEVKAFATVNEDLQLPQIPARKEPEVDKKMMVLNEIKKVEELGGFYEPTDINKGVDVSEVTNEDLVRYHDNMHILWNKVEDGYRLDWNFAEIYLLHSKIYREMIKREISHLEPIGELDNIKV